MLLLVIRKVENAGTSGLSNELSAVLDQQWPIVVAFAVGGAFLAILYLSFLRRRRRRSPGGKHPLPTSRRQSEGERQFHNVFALTSQERRQAIIEFYMRKHGCGREKAMVIAVEDRASDETRW
jgi:hypothetical protein